MGCIAQSWYRRSALEVAPDLLGCILVRQQNGQETRSVIVETEAYTEGDPACHAYRRKTKRNASMFCAGGVSYVYLIYGMYHCLNIVTDQEAIASAVLIRAVDIQLSLLDDSALTKAERRVGAGPGKLCRWLEIDRTHDGVPLQTGQPLWLEHRPHQFDQWLVAHPQSVTQTTRIGLTKGVELPWRWYLNHSLAVSKR